MKILKVFLVLTAILFSSCDSFRTGQKVVLWTDRPELITYGEVYNAEHEYKVEIVYKDSPAEELASGRAEVPDIVIAPYLNSKQIIGSFTDLGELFEDSSLERESFYQEALELGKTTDGQQAIPFSFNIPVFVFRTGEVDQNISPFALDSNSFVEVCTVFNNSRSSLRKSSFSPLWDKRNPFFFAFISDSNFYESETGTFSVDGTSLENNLQFMRGLIVRLSGNFESEKAFREKFLYMQPTDLLEKRRIFLSYSDVNSFCSIPDSKRKNLNFRYYMNEKQRISVCEDMLYAAIPSKGKNRKGAVDFLLWIMDEKVQQDMLERTKSMGIRSFGIAGGLSALKNINENTIPRMYPFMVGHVPIEEILNFPVPCPPDFDRLRDEAIIPWLYKQTGQESTTSDLQETIDNWRRMNAAL